MIGRMPLKPRLDPPATRQRRIDEFGHEGAPPPGLQMQLLCQDNSGTYVVPFPCIYMDGRWINARTSEPIDAEVVGWRAPRT